MADLYGGMTDKMFEVLAATSIAKWWNSQEDLIKNFGRIHASEVYTTWKCKAIENFKGLFGVPRDGDGLYFEFTYHAAKNRCYLDVYKKQTQVIVPFSCDNSSNSTDVE
jgi:hypothetical protein